MDELRCICGRCGLRLQVKITVYLNPQYRYRSDIATGLDKVKLPKYEVFGGRIQLTAVVEHD